MIDSKADLHRAAMATIEQVTVLLRQNAEFMQNMQNQQIEAMKQMLAQMSKSSGGGPPRDLRERQFRELGGFNGDEQNWKEWVLKFTAAVKEANPDIYEELKWAATREDEIDSKQIEKEYGESGLEHSTMIYNRLITHLNGGALVIHQTVTRECGHEVWRLLHKRYNPVTPMRGIQLMLRVINPGRVQKGQDVQVTINKWEGQVAVLERDYREDISDRMKIGILIRMMPEDLQDIILQHADRLQDYKLVKEKAVHLIDARERLKDPNAMDVGYVDDGEYEEDVGAVTKDTKCYRCGGYGHLAVHCATPKGEGKGKGREKGTKGGDYGKGKYSKGGGKSYEGKGFGKNGKGRQVCDYCGKTGHGPDNCWTKHPEQLPWKRTSAVDWEEEEHEHDIGCIDAMKDVPVPPGLKCMNRFEALASDDEEEDEEVPLGILEIEEEERDVKAVTQQKIGKMTFAGKGKITIDSGAAESVMPKNMLENEPVVEGQAKRNGVKYVAANGARMENQGEKKVRFKKPGSDTMNSITFQVTDVGKPLASVSRILDKGNTVVFSRGGSGSYIRNDKTGEKTPIKEEKGTFVIEVDYYQPEDFKAKGFARQGR